jgi:hypothetical protein
MACSRGDSSLLVVVVGFLEGVEGDSASGVDVVLKPRDAVEDDPVELHVANHQRHFVDVVPGPCSRREQMMTLWLQLMASAEVADEMMEVLHAKQFDGDMYQTPSHSTYPFSCPLPGIKQ